MSIFVIFFSIHFSKSIPLPSFPEGSPWQLNIKNSTNIDPNSESITEWLQNEGGFGYGKFQTDESMVVLYANSHTNMVPFVKDSEYYSSDCNDKISQIPIPSKGGLEGYYSWESASECTGDCHLIVYNTDSHILYESWSTKITLNSAKNYPVSITSTCLVLWNTSYLYPYNQRGDGCTSADAAGFPISTLLFTADEINSGYINHAIRFILPNSRMRKGYYTHPGTHFGGPQSSDPYAPIYGSRWRLKSSFNMDGYSNAAKVVLKALQEYGMFLADGGNIALTAMTDKINSNISYNDVGFSTHDLNDVKPTDFDVMMGWGPNPVVGYNSYLNCVKNNIPVFA